MSQPKYLRNTQPLIIQEEGSFFGKKTGIFIIETGVSFDEPKKGQDP